jgi:hypothetical protein
MRSLLLAGGLVACMLFSEYGAANGQANSGQAGCAAQSASVTGLADFELHGIALEEMANSSYSGGDTFELVTNSPVSLQIRVSELRNGNSRLRPRVWFDGLPPGAPLRVDTQGRSSHKVRVATELGAVSDQLAGDYFAELTVTVLPDALGRRPTCVKAEAAVNQPLDPAEDTAAGGEVVATQDRESGLPVPPQFRELMQHREAMLIFPMLAEYLAWQSGERASLSTQAAQWWLYPIDPGALRRLQEANNR